jgi:dihydroneopterin aldolase
MQQFGYVLASMSSEFVLANTTEKINQAWNLSKVVIWEPYLMVSDQCTLDRTWDVTSDSLAAWLASELGMRNLLLIKSSEKVLETTDLTELARVECVDIGLQDLVDRYQINAFVIHKSKLDSLSEWFNSV